MTNPTRQDFAYIEFSYGNSMSLENFQEQLAGILEGIRDLGGSEITVEVDSDRDLAFNFVRPKTDQEIAADKQRMIDAEIAKLRSAEQDHARAQGVIADKRALLKKLADDLGVTISE